MGLLGALVSGARWAQECERSYKVVEQIPKERKIDHMSEQKVTTVEGLAGAQIATTPFSIARQALAAADGMERDRVKLVAAVIELTRETPEAERTPALDMANYYADLIKQSEENAGSTTNPYAQRSFWGTSRDAEIQCRSFLRLHIAERLSADQSYHTFDGEVELRQMEETLARQRGEGLV